MSLQTFAQPAVVRQFHDDWLLWNVYADGTVREFDTEFWPEHYPADGSGDKETENWPLVLAVAAGTVQPLHFLVNGLPFPGGRLLRFRLATPDVDEPTFWRLFDAWFESLGDWPSDAQLYAPEPTA